MKAVTKIFLIGGIAIMVFAFPRGYPIIFIPLDMAITLAWVGIGMFFIGRMLSMGAKKRFH